MPITGRISLPGYDAATDTNLDHYALYADQDNVLIKEFTRGGTTVGAASSFKIAHNLGYVPFFLVYVSFAFNQPNGWSLVPSYQNNGFSEPPYVATSDTGTLTITNNEGTARNYKWYIFYDNFTNGTTTFTQSKEAIKIAKAGIDAGTAIDPSSFIFHSDLNTFKIIKEGTVNINYTSGTTGGTYSFNHNAGLGTPTSYMAFMKFPDGKTALLPGKGDVYSYDSNWQVFNTSIDGSQIAMNITGTGNTTLPLKYYIFETPLG